MLVGSVGGTKPARRADHQHNQWPGLALFIAFAVGFGLAPGLPGAPTFGSAIDRSGRIPESRRPSLLRLSPDGPPAGSPGDPWFGYRYREVRASGRFRTIPRGASPRTGPGRMRGRAHSDPVGTPEGNPDFARGRGAGPPASSQCALPAGRATRERGAVRSHTGRARSPRPLCAGRGSAFGRAGVAWPCRRILLSD